MAGNHVWITSSNPDVADDYVTELNAKTGKLVRVISAARYGFDSPDGVASTSKRVWVTNTRGFSVTELNAKTGALVRVISGKRMSTQRPCRYSRRWREFGVDR